MDLGDAIQKEDFKALVDRDNETERNDILSRTKICESIKRNKKVDIDHEEDEVEIVNESSKQRFAQPNIDASFDSSPIFGGTLYTEHNSFHDIEHNHPSFRKTNNNQDTSICID